MNRLPAVLQREIWEYVRGDRAFWKGQFELVIDGLEWAFAASANIFDEKPWENRNFVKTVTLGVDKQRQMQGQECRKLKRYLSSINEPMDEDDEYGFNLHMLYWMPDMRHLWDK
jgi:hypothetical protein